MSVELLEAPPAAAAPVPVPSTGGKTSMDSLINDFMVRENIPSPSVKVEGQGDQKLPSLETPPVETPPAEVVEKTPAAPVVSDTPAVEPPHLASVRARKIEAELKKQVEEQAARLKELSELEGLRPKWEEATTQLTEKQRLLEEAEKKHAELESYYRNEASALSTNPMELEPVRNAAIEANRRLNDLIPDDLSGEDEAPLPLRKDTFIQENLAIIHETVDYWKKILGNNDMPSADKGTLQHIALSTLARRAGVDEKHFSNTEYRGQNYFTVDPRHPVFKHLKARMGDLVRATDTFTALKGEAEKAPMESASKIISKRGEASLEAQKKMGIGVFGNDLKALREKAPDDDMLAALSALEGHEDLVAELTAEQKRQGLLNAHKVRKFDIPVPDPKKYNETGRMLQLMDMERDVTAPLIKPAVKLIARMARKEKNLEAEIEKLKAEINKRSMQGEAGSPRAGESVTETKTGFTKPGFQNADTLAYLTKNGLL